MKTRTIPLFLLAILLLPMVFATVDLVGPANGTFTNQTSLRFDYYASIPGFSGCTVRVDGNVFPDLDAQTNAMNELTIINIVSGQHAWNVSCTGANSTEISQTRTFVIDSQPPTLAVLAPANGSYATAVFDAIPNDDLSSTLSCSALWNGEEMIARSVAPNTHFTGNISLPPGSGTLKLLCSDSAGNTMYQERLLTIQPNLFLQVSMPKSEYGLGELVSLTIDTVPGANVTIDVCPNQQGFVQCGTALIDSLSFPQTITLPYMNRTGEYLVETVVKYAGQTKTNRTLYKIANTISINPDIDGEQITNKTITLSVSPSGGILPYRTMWKLSNGSTIQDASSITRKYPVAGIYNETVTVSDAANNSKTENITVVVAGVNLVTVSVVDNATSAPISGAEVDISNNERLTGQDGRALFEIEDGEHTILVSAAGYRYGLEEYIFNATSFIVIRLVRDDVVVPDISLLQPTEASVTANPVRIQYTVTYQSPVTCTLLVGTPDNWFSTNGTMDVSDDGQKEFVRQFPDGEQRIRIECADSEGKKGGSQILSFVVDSTIESAEEVFVADLTPTDDEVRLQQYLERLDALLSTIDAYNQDEKEVIGIIGFDKQLRNTKRAVQQAIRDIDSLQYRAELDITGKQAERSRIISEIDALITNTPQGVTVTDSKSFVRYLKKDVLDEVSAELAGLDGFPSEPKMFKDQLLEDQQLFTVTSKFVQVQYLYANGNSSTVTVITRTFTYANDLGNGYGIVDIIPKTVIDDATKLTLLSKGTILKKDPVLRFEKSDSITYIIPKKVDFTLLEGIHTVITGRYPEKTGVLTGFAIFGAGDVDVLGMPLWILLIVIVLLYLAYYFDLVKQIKYIKYRFGKNEQVHYLRVIIRDAYDQLDANNYEKAEMLYKEVRLTYDTLSILAKNDLYEEVMALVKRMDVYYFNLVMMEMDQYLKVGDLESAIRSYEKLTGTFERLDEEHQNQLIISVHGMAKRLGVTA